MPNPTPEEHKRIVDAALKKMPLEPLALTEDERIMQRAMAATRRIRDQFTPAIAKHGFPDRKLHGLAIGKAFLEEFHTWDKADLIYLLCVIHTDTLLEKLR